VSELVELVPNPDGEVVWHAVVTLGEIGPDAAPAVSVLLAALTDGSRRLDVENRERMVEALGKIGAPAEAAIPLLLRIIQDPQAVPAQKSPQEEIWEPRLQITAITSAGQIDNGSPEVLPMLRLLVASGPNGFRLSAVKALA